MPDEIQSAVYPSPCAHVALPGVREPTRPECLRRRAQKDRTAQAKAAKQQKSEKRAPKRTPEAAHQHAIVLCILTAP